MRVGGRSARTGVLGAPGSDAGGRSLYAGGRSLYAVSSIVAGAAVLTYVVALLVTFSSSLWALYSSSDIAMAPYLTELWLKAPAGSELLMGHAPFYLGLWIFRFLHLFPGQRLSWQLAPWVLSVGGSVAVARGVLRAAGREAALLVGASLICAGTYLLQMQFAWGIHALAYLNVMLLSAFIVWLAREDPRPLLLWSVALLLTAVTAAGVATDKLVIVAGLLPFAAAGVPLAWHAARAGMRQQAAAVLLVVAGSVAGAFVVRAAMRSERLRATAFPIHAAGVGSIPSHLLLLAQSVFSLLNGYLHESGAAPPLLRGAFGYACSAAVSFLIVLAVLEPVALLRRRDAGRLGRQNGQGDGARSAAWGLVAHDRGLAGGLPRYLNAAFWSVCAVAVSFVYVDTDLASSIATRRYVVPVAYAVLVLGITRGTAAGRRIRMLTLAAVTTLLAAGISSLFDRSLARIQATSPTVAMARDLDRLVAREHVGVVYAGYWDSYALGWLGDRVVAIRPVFTYRDQLVEGVGSGAGFAGIISPHTVGHARRSLLILDGVLDPGDGMSRVALPGLGAPAARTTLAGGRLEAYLYRYDIATRFFRLAGTA